MGVVVLRMALRTADQEDQDFANHKARAAALGQDRPNLELVAVA